MMYSSAFALALLSTAFAAPAVVESPFGLVSTLTANSDLDGFIVFSKDDGTLWLRSPEGVETIQMLGNMNIEGKVLGMNGTSLYIGDDSALTLSGDKTTDMLINQESVLSTGDSVIMAACPSNDGYQLFSGAITCENRVDVTLRAVTDGSAPLTEATNNLDVKQNFCCLKSCFRCGGCNTHSRPSTCAGGCSNNNNNWAPSNGPWGPHSSNGNNWHSGNGNGNGNWNNGNGNNWNNHGSNSNCNNGNSNNWNNNNNGNHDCGHYNPTPSAPDCTHVYPTGHPCPTCGDGNGPVITGTHREPETSTATSTHSCPTCGDGTGPIVPGTHREPETSATVTSSGTHYTNGTFTITSAPCTATQEPTTVIPVPAPTHDCGSGHNDNNHNGNSDCGCGQNHHIPAPAPGPGPHFGPGPGPAPCACQGEYHDNNCSGGNGGAHFCPKNALCGICSKLPCPKSVLCNLCNVRPCACGSGSGSGSNCSNCGDSAPCGCEQPSHPAPVPYHPNHSGNNGGNNGFSGGHHSGNNGFNGNSCGNCGGSAQSCGCPLAKLKNLCPGKLLCGGCKQCR